jgi:hypothetical protein
VKNILQSKLAAEKAALAKAENGYNTCKEALVSIRSALNEETTAQLNALADALA